MYYLKITDDNNLVYYCRNCGHEDTNLPNQTICVYDSHIDNDAEHKLEHVVNEYTKYDLTLPRVSNIQCPNPECVNNRNGATTAESINGGYTEGGSSPDKSIKYAEQTELLSSPISSKVSTKNASSIKSKLQNNMRDIVSIRYDDIAMKYAYMCTVCDTVWKAGNN